MIRSSIETEGLKTMTKKEEKLLIRIFAKRITDLTGAIAHLEKYSAKKEDSATHGIIEKHRAEIKEIQALEKKILNK
jgi:hypothetical protein